MTCLGRKKLESPSVKAEGYDGSSMRFEVKQTVFKSSMRTTYKLYYDLSKLLNDQL